MGWGEVGLWTTKMRTCEKNFSLWLLSTLEDYAVQNLRLKTFILSLRMAEEPGFFCDDILRRPSLSPDSERDLQHVTTQLACVFYQLLIINRRLYKLDNRLKNRSGGVKGNSFLFGLHMILPCDMDSK